MSVTRSVVVLLSNLKRVMLVFLVVYLMLQVFTLSSGVTMLHDTQVSVDYQDVIFLLSAQKDAMGNELLLVSQGGHLSLVPYSFIETPRLKALWCVFSGESIERARAPVYFSDPITLLCLEDKMLFCSSLTGASNVISVDAHKKSDHEPLLYFIAQHDFLSLCMKEKFTADLLGLLHTLLRLRRERQVKVHDFFYILIAQKHNNTIQYGLLMRDVHKNVIVKSLEQKDAPAGEGSLIKEIKNRPECLWSIGGLRPFMLTIGDCLCLQDSTGFFLGVSPDSDGYLSVVKHQVSESDTQSDACYTEWQIAPLAHSRAPYTFRGNLIKRKHSYFMLQNKFSGAYLFDDTRSKKRSLQLGWPYFNYALKKYHDNRSFEWFIEPLDRSEHYLRTKTKVRIINRATGRDLAFDHDSFHDKKVVLKTKKAKTKKSSCAVFDHSSQSSFFWIPSACTSNTLIYNGDRLYLRHKLSGAYLSLDAENNLFFSQEPSCWILRSACNDMVQRNAFKTKDTVIFLHENSKLMLFCSKKNTNFMLSACPVTDALKKSPYAHWSLRLGIDKDELLREKESLRLCNLGASHGYLAADGVSFSAKAQLVSLAHELACYGHNDCTLLSLELIPKDGA